MLMKQKAREARDFFFINRFCDSFARAIRNKRFSLRYIKTIGKMKVFVWWAACFHSFPRPSAWQ
jgi:hypothetical protein